MSVPTRPTLSELVQTKPGNKFDGDRVIFYNGRQFRLPEVAWALREFVLNEERLRALRPHWKREPKSHVLAYLDEAICAEDEEEFARVCERYRLWRYWR